MAIIVGFTGTQVGMTQRQSHELYKGLLEAFEEGAEFRHGDCINSDVQAAGMAKEIGYIVVAHPGTDAQGQMPKRGWFAKNDRILPPKQYLDRNQDIVSASSVLYATPKETVERLRNSGTWATIRYGKKKGIPVHILYP